MNKPKIYRVEYEVIEYDSCLVYANSEKEAIRVAEDYEGLDRIEGATAERIYRKELESWQGEEIVNPEA